VHHLVDDEDVGSQGVVDAAYKAAAMARAGLSRTDNIAAYDESRRDTRMRVEIRAAELLTEMGLCRQALGKALFYRVCRGTAGDRAKEAPLFRAGLSLSGCERCRCGPIKALAHGRAAAS
jgi:hypothetical protein